METAKITITGKMPLLMHADNIDWADQMEAWKNDPKNKALSKAGDDRTPPWRWVGCLNCDDVKDGVVTIPVEYLMRSMMDGAAQVPTGKNKGTFKSISQSGILCAGLHFPLLIRGRQISMVEINKCLAMETFKEQRDAAERLGFSLFVKRAAVGTSKHIRVRPRFDDWSFAGELLITEKQITKDVLRTILEIAGRLKGLGDWRPGAPKRPGPFGTFTATVE